MQLPSANNIPGNAVAQFGQDLIRFGEMGLRRQSALDQAQRDVEISKAYTTMNEAVVGKLREFQQTWDTTDETGQPHYKGFGEHFDSYREQLWAELSKTFSDPQTADLFFPTFNEAMSQQKIKVDELVQNYKHRQVQEDFLTLVDRTVQMPGVSPERKKNDLKTELANMIQHGIISADEAAAVEQEKFYEIDLNAVGETAATVFNSQGWDATRSYLMRAEGIAEEDRKKLLTRFENEADYQKKQYEEAKKIRGEEQYRTLMEQVEEGKITTADYLHDIIGEYGPDLSESQYDKLRNAIGAQRTARATGLKSDAAYENEIRLMHLRGEDLDVIEDEIFRGMNGENFEDGQPRLTAEDGKKLLDEIKKESGGFTRVMDEIKAKLMEHTVAAKKGEDPLLTESEAATEIAELIEFARQNLPEGAMRTPQSPKIDESLLWDRYNAIIQRRTEDRVKFKALRSFMDSAPLLPLSPTEKVLEEAEQGLYTGVVQEDVIGKYMRLPEIADYDSMTEEIAQTGYGRRFDRLSERDQNEVIANANMVVVLHNLKNAAADELGVSSPILALTNRGGPLVIDSESGTAYTARTVDKDEKWFYWDGRLEDYVPLERD